VFFQHERRPDPQHHGGTSASLVHSPHQPPLHQVVDCERPRAEAEYILLGSNKHHLPLLWHFQELLAEGPVYSAECRQNIQIVFCRHFDFLHEKLIS